MAKKNIQAQERKAVGKHNKKLRRVSEIPAVIYGPGRDSQNIKVDEKEVTDILRAVRSSSLIEVEIDGKKHDTFVAEIQTNPRDGSLTHVSFFEPDAAKPIVIGIEVVTTGIAPAVKNNIGILFQARDEVLVRALPKAVVEKLEVDVTELKEIGDTITIGEITLPADVELADPKDAGRAAVTITPFQKEIEEEEETAEGEEDEEKEGEESTEGDDAEASEEAPAEGGE